MAKARPALLRRRLLLAASAIVLLALLAHESPEPWILGRYSLPYVIFTVLGLLLATYACIALPRFGSKAWWTPLCALVAGLAAFEAIGQLVAHRRPAYTVLFLQPDRVLGWKLVPGLSWNWTGTFWYAREFSVPVAANSHGFRGRERGFSKPPGCARIALLGDSFVEAMQVPLEETAGGLLEHKLNRATEGDGPRFEVLNFGVSNYSVGQYLLAWEEYASRFAPDLVFAFVGGIQARRTADRYKLGAFASTRHKRLWIRPTFRLEDGELVREAAADFEQYVALHRGLLRGRFREGRMQRRPREWFLAGLLERTPYRRLMELQRRLQVRRDALAPQPYGLDETLELNLVVLDELNTLVRKAGGRLVVVDAFRYFRDVNSPERVKDFCEQSEIERLPLSDVLLRANEVGASTRWKHDGHFNRLGNRIFADAMFGWMGENGYLPTARDGR